MGLAVQCVVCASCQGPRGSLKVSGPSEPLRLDGSVWVCVCVCCVTVGEYHDIKQYHSGLCARTQGTLCTFHQGWGDGGEAEGEGGHSMVAACILSCHSGFTTVGLPGEKLWKL